MLNSNILGVCTVSENAVRVVIFKEADQWIAQMLEHDICAQGPDLDTVRERFLATLRAEVAESERNGHAPLENIGPAPALFEQKWNQRSSFAECRDGDDGVPVEFAIAA